MDRTGRDAGCRQGAPEPEQHDDPEREEQLLAQIGGAERPCKGGEHVSSCAGRALGGTVGANELLRPVGVEPRTAAVSAMARMDPLPGEGNSRPGATDGCRTGPAAYCHYRMISAEL